MSQRSSECRRVVSEIERRLGQLQTVPHLEVLTGLSVFRVYVRAVRSALRRVPWFGAAAVLALVAALLWPWLGRMLPRWLQSALEGFPWLLALVLIVTLPLGLGVVYGHRALRRGRGESVTLVTDRAHLVVAVTWSRGRVVLVPTDHWVDRRKVGRQIIRGQATHFRREVLRVLIGFVLQRQVAVKAKAANPKVREMYARDIYALGYEAAPLLVGKRRLYVTPGLLRALPAAAKE